MRFAVIGNPIAHSLSPVIHQQFAKQTGIDLIYSAIQGDSMHFEKQVMDFFLQGGKGLNITLPFKTRAFALAEIRTPRCLQAGASNTLWMEQGKLCADNTDGVGLLRDLSRHTDLQDKSILILGAGGAARGIIAPLLSSKPTCLMLANRSLDNALLLLKDFPQVSWCDFNLRQEPFNIIINATSANHFTLPDSIFSPNTFCYDLTYNHQKPTKFVQFMKNKGCEAVHGIGMLIEQAAEAFRIWHGILPDVASIATDQFLRLTIEINYKDL